MENTIEFFKTIETKKFKGYKLEKFYMPILNDKGKELVIRTIKIVKDGKELHLVNCYRNARKWVTEQIEGIKPIKEEKIYITDESFKDGFGYQKKDIRYRENY